MAWKEKSTRQGKEKGRSSAAGKESIQLRSGVEPKDQRHDNIPTSQDRMRQPRKGIKTEPIGYVQAYQDHSFQPVGSSILHDVVDGQHGEEEYDRLERVEEHRDRTTDDPPEGDDEGYDKQGNLLEK